MYDSSRLLMLLALCSKAIRTPGPTEASTVRIAGAGRLTGQLALLQHRLGEVDANQDRQLRSFP